MMITVVMFAVFMFIFANSVQMLCRLEQNQTFTCIIEKRLLSYLPTSRRTVTGVTSAKTVESCDSDGCSYRVELQTANGGSEPFDDVYTDRFLVNPLTERINEKIATTIRQGDERTFSENVEMQWWVVILLGVLAGISLLVELALVFQAAYKWWMSRV
jgi:hypothetical protein